ncbi:MAG TPA: DegV family protein [Bacilli bacterium]
MNKFQLLTDSCVDLPSGFVEELDVKVIPLSFSIQDKEYLNYLDERESSNQQFYQLLRERVISKTTQINEYRFIEFFEPFLQEGYDILYIGFSSALSGTYNSSVQAANELQTKYPNQKIITIDSLAASMGQGLLVTYAARLKKEGKSLEEIVKWVEDNKRKICHLFTVGDLNYLRRGGRLSYSKALLGTILRVKPLLHVSNEGKLVQTGMKRGRMSALDAMISRLVETIENPEGQTIFISHGDCLDDAEYVKEQIKAKLPVGEIMIHYIGPVIGSHSGLDTLAIFYYGNDR